MRRHISLISTALGWLALAALLTGCMSSTAPTNPSAATAQPLRIGMVLIGTAADGGWNSAAADGLRRLRSKFDAEIDYTEVPFHEDWAQTPPAEWIAALRDYAEQDYPLVFAHGRRFDTIVPLVAPDYPNTRFVITGGTVKGPNYASVTLKNEETGYVLGVLAGLTTKTNVLGTTSGADMLPFVSTINAFKQGALEVNPKVTFVEHPLNDSQGDPNKYLDEGRKVAIALADQQADVIFIRSSAAGIGIIKGAEERHIYVINYGKDVTNTAPQTVLANGVQFIPTTMETMTQHYIAGDFEGKNYLMGLADGALNLSPLRDELVPADVQKRVAQTEQDLISGALMLEANR